MQQTPTTTHEEIRAELERVLASAPLPTPTEANGFFATLLRLRSTMLMNL